MLANLLKKAPLCGAFLLSLSVVHSFAHAQSCSPCNSGLIEVAAVIDGDTLRLEDGRSLRLIGVNTPELGHGKADEPGAREARRLLELLVSRSGGFVRICLDAERRDRYGRQLAHLYDRDGRNINRQLLQHGAGYLIAIPPNLKNHGCYRDAESQARGDARGLWRQPVAEASDLLGDESGFHILTGYIERVGESRSGVWLDLEGGLALRITWDDWDDFGIDDPESLLHTGLEVRGWIYHRNGQQRIRVRHPASIRWLTRS
jgi:endonuclease YncB( thermonuclease family)